MGATRPPFIIGLYSDAPRAGKTTSAKVLSKLVYEAKLPCDVVSFAFPIRRAARQILPASWDETKVRAHLSGHLKDTPIGELGGKTGRDLLKLVGNTIRRQVRDDLWADRLLEEIDNLGNDGVCIIDDLRYPGEFFRLRDRGAFLVRLVTSRPLMAIDGDDTEGQLFGCQFDAEVPAKGLVPQEVLEKLIADLWRDRIRPSVRGCDGSA